VNLRKDHYRVHALTGRSPTLEYYTLVALAGRGNTTGPGLCVPARGNPNSVFSDV